MLCDQVKTQLSAYMDGEVSAQEAEEIEAHLRDCPDCATLLAEYEKLREQTQLLAPQAPDMLASLQAQQKLIPQNNSKVKHIQKWSVRLGAAAAVFVVMIVGVLYFANNGAKKEDAAPKAAMPEVFLEENAAGDYAADSKGTVPFAGEATPNEGNAALEKQGDYIVLYLSEEEAQAMIDQLAAQYTKEQMDAIVQPTKEGYLLDFSIKELPVDMETEELLAENNAKGFIIIVL